MLVLAVGKGDFLRFHQAQTEMPAQFSCQGHQISITEPTIPQQHNPALWREQGRHIAEQVSIVLQGHGGALLRQHLPSDGDGAAAVDKGNSNDGQPAGQSGGINGQIDGPPRPGGQGRAQERFVVMAHLDMLVLQQATHPPLPASGFGLRCDNRGPEGEVYGLLQDQAGHSPSQTAKAAEVLIRQEFTQMTEYGRMEQEAITHNAPPGLFGCGLIMPQTRKCMGDGLNC